MPRENKTNKENKCVKRELVQEREKLKRIRNHRWKRSRYEISVKLKQKFQEECVGNASSFRDNAVISRRRSSRSRIISHCFASPDAHRSRETRGYHEQLHIYWIPSRKIAAITSYMTPTFHRIKFNLPLTLPRIKKSSQAVAVSQFILTFKK